MGLQPVANLLSIVVGLEKFLPLTINSFHGLFEFEEIVDKRTEVKVIDAASM